MNVIDTDQLLEEHANADGRAKWDVPFPMGVFGTLRKGWGNTGLMGGSPDEPLEDDDEKCYYRHSRDYSYEAHFKAFMPHWSASGLSISHHPGASGVFEVFIYAPDHWKKMIVNVDRLEGFRLNTDGADKNRSGYYRHGYHRTLAWLHVLPDDYEHEQYANHTNYFGVARDPRTLDIPSAEWSDYPRIPCWVYGSIHENELSLELDDSPVIWFG